MYDRILLPDYYFVLNLIAFPLILLTLGYLFKFIAKHHYDWTSFYSITIIFIVELMTYRGCTSIEFVFYFDLIFFFYFSVNTLLVVYFYSYFYRCILTMTFIIFKYFQDWFSCANDELWYFLTNHIFIRNSLDYMNKHFKNILKKNELSNYYITLKNVNKNMLKYSLNKKYHIFLNVISIFYISVFIIAFLYHFTNVEIWYHWDFSMVYHWYYESWYIFMYFMFLCIFSKLFLNSICFDQLLSYNFLRFVDYTTYHTLADDLLNWEPSLSATIILNEEIAPHETSIHLTNWFIDPDKAERVLGFRHDLTTKEVSFRFYIPARWSFRKHYIMDSYDKTILQYLNIQIDRYFNNVFDNETVFFKYYKKDFEFNLYLKI